MGKETRPEDYPKLINYQPTRFMLPTSYYDKKKADRAVTFIENLCHTKGKWAGKRFWLLPWQEQLIRDIFGIVKSDGNRQFRTAFVEICKKVGKSELAAAIALYLLYADNEPSAEVYGAAADRQQASIVFDVARQMVEMSPALMKRSKLMSATKRIVNYGNTGFYQVLSAEVGSKHGFSISGLVFDEIHTQPNRQLYDVLTKYSSDARQNPLHFIITTAGNDRHSIAFELHAKAVDILEGRRVDPTFYPDCGMSMIRRSDTYGKGRKVVNYICSNYNRNRQCSRHTIRESELTESILETLRSWIEIVADADRLAQRLNDMTLDYDSALEHDREIEELRKELLKYDTLKSSLYQDLKDGLINETQFNRYREEYTNRGIKVRDAIAEQERIIRDIYDKGIGCGMDLDILREKLNIGQIDRVLLVTLVDRILIHKNGDIEVILKMKDEIGKVKILAEMAGFEMTGEVVG